MSITNVKRVVEQVSKDKGIKDDVLLKALKEALRSAAKKKFGNNSEIEVNYNTNAGEIEVFQFKEVVNEVIDPNLQISFEEGIKLDPECELGDSLGAKIDLTTFGRIAAQSAKQVIIQKIKDAERDAVYSGYINRKGEIINGIIQRTDKGSIIVNLGITEGILFSKEQIPYEEYKRGDRIRALIIDILYETKGPQIILSRTHPDFLASLFKIEVPEINEGIIDIKGAAREPGSRAKFSVSTTDSDIDPIGACVGVKGSRVRNVVRELKGEKIDIVAWHIDPAKYVCSALAPAKITRVVIDEENHSMEVIVPDEFLSIAIGKHGQNVKLASKLTGWNLDVSGETSYNKVNKSKYKPLINMPGINLSFASMLMQFDINSPYILGNAIIKNLVKINKLNKRKIILLINFTKSYLNRVDKNRKFFENSFNNCNKNIINFLKLSTTTKSS